MIRVFFVLSAVIAVLLCAPALVASPGGQELSAEAIVQAGSPQALAAAEDQDGTAPAEEPAGIDDFGKDFGELLVPKPIPAFCPHNQPCLGGFFCEEYEKCPVPSCVGGKCRYE